MLKKKLQGTLAIVNGTTQGERTFAVIPDLNRSKDILGRFTYDAGWITPGASVYFGQGQNLEAAPLRFKQFPRWALNLELQAQHTFVKKLGRTRFVGEVTRAQNMDRGVTYGFALPPIPVLIGDEVTNHDELGVYARVEQDLTQWATIGARWDYYSPDTAQEDDGRHTFAFVGAAHFTKGLQAMLEFDHAIDHVHRPGAPITSKEIETVSAVLQARF